MNDTVSGVHEEIADILDRHACDIVGEELVTTLQLSFVHYNFISCDSVGRI